MELNADLTSGCPLVAFFLTLPPFCVGYVIWKRLLLHYYFVQFIYICIYILLDVSIKPFNVNSVVAYSVKV